MILCTGKPLIDVLSCSFVVLFRDISNGGGCRMCSNEIPCDYRGELREARSLSSSSFSTGFWS